MSVTELGCEWCDAGLRELTLEDAEAQVCYETGPYCDFDLGGKCWW